MFKEYKIENIFTTTKWRYWNCLLVIHKRELFTVLNSVLKLLEESHV